MRQTLAYLALTAAAAASIATRGPGMPPRYQGRARVEGPAFLASPERPRWDFEILCAFELPPDAEAWDWRSSLEARLRATEPPDDLDVQVWLTDCDDDVPLAERELSVTLRDIHEPCLADLWCELRVCLHVASLGEQPAELELVTEGGLEAYGRDRDDGTDLLEFYLEVTLLSPEEDL